MKGEPQAVGIDVGGTKINALRVTLAGEVLARETLPTPAEDMEATLDRLVEAGMAVTNAEVIAVGCGAAGLVETATGIMRFAPNIVWRDAPIAERMRQAFGLPVAVDNDCTAAAYAELRLGVARGHEDVLYLGVGTGIGGGIVMDGEVRRGAHGFAGEVGHIVVEPGGPACGCGNRGCWEAVASGRAITREGRSAVAHHTHSLLSELADGDPERLTGTMVTEAAQAGDPTANGILAEVGHRLGEGIAGLVNVLDPELVVIGGGAAGAGELLLTPARVSFRMAVEARELHPDVPIVEGALGPDAAAIGAAMMALDALA
jgi:glucokinase